MKFCRDIKYYLSQEMAEDKESSAKVGYPVDILGSEVRELRVWFMHGYADFANAKAKWEERSKRIHWDNIYFIMTDGTGCDEKLAAEFDALPYKHKAFLTYREHQIYSDITSDEILNRLREPIPVCRYCVTAKPSRKFTWGLTRKDIHEWL